MSLHDSSVLGGGVGTVSATKFNQIHLDKTILQLNCHGVKHYDQFCVCIPFGALTFSTNAVSLDTPVTCNLHFKSLVG